MKKSLKIPTDQLRRLLALSLAIALLNLTATLAFASRPDSMPLGMLVVSGTVTVNDLPAVSSQTILSGSRIITATRSSSILELGKFTRLSISEETEFALDFSDAAISGLLKKGGIRAFIPVARKLSIVTSGGVVATDSSQSAALSVQIDGDITRIWVESGRVEFQTANGRRWIAAGEMLAFTGDSSVVPAPGQNLSQAAKIGLFAGIGAGLAIILVAIIGTDNPTEEFGGCPIVPSGSNDGRGICP